MWAELNKKEERERERERKIKGRGRERDKGRKGRDSKEQKPKQVFVSFLLSFLVLVLILVLVLVPFSPLARLRMSGHCCTCVDRKVQCGCAFSSSHWILLQKHPAHPLHTLPFFVLSVSLLSRGWSYDAFPYFGLKKKARFQHILVCFSGARCWCCLYMCVPTHRKNPPDGTRTGQTLGSFFSQPLPRAMIESLSLPSSLQTPTLKRIISLHKKSRTFVTAHLIQRNDEELKR